MSIGSLVPSVALAAFLVSFDDPDWRPLDDPDADRVPAALRELPHATRSILRSPSRPRYLIDRAIADHADAFAAFMADEEVMARYGEFIPLDDRIVEHGGGEVFEFECEWNQDPVAARILAAYRETEAGAVRALWLVTNEEASFDALRAEVEAALAPESTLFDPMNDQRYRGILLGHELCFDLRISPGGGDAAGDAIRLRPVEVGLAADAVFHDAVTEVNPQFESGVIRQWADDERGVSLSLQVFATDVSLGPKEAFVYWIAGQYQGHMRGDPDDGDLPIELVHLPDVTTRVVDDAEIERHYANNARAPEGGVILGVYLPRSPLARVCQLRWPDTHAARLAAARSAEPPDATDAPDPPHTPRHPKPPTRPAADEESAAPRPPEPDRFGLVRFVELREYRRSRSETITRAFVVMLLARSESKADLDLLESRLGLTVRPLETGPEFPLPR